MIGKNVSHYKILEKLGEGGMGVVYKAEDLKLTRTVALKFLPHGLNAHEPERERFLQEARAAAILNHPNICTVYDIAEYEGQQFIVMEYVDGKTLREVIPIKKMQDAIGYAIQIAEALQEAHTHGIVHRDIKAENIMVNSKNQVKVMDFGLAKLKGSLKLTKTSSTVGTLAYMAPEQIQGGEVDTRSDIFSFGVVFYEMLSGHLPFRGEHEAAMVYSIVNEEPEPLQHYVSDAPSELLHILDRALEKDREDRYQTVHDMLIDLRRLKKETSRVSLQPHDEPPVLGTAVPVTTVKGMRGWRKLRWIGSAALIVLCAVAVLLFLPRTHAARLNPNRTSVTLQIPVQDIQYPSLSRDGKWAAFPGRDEKGKCDVYLMNIAGGKPNRVTDESANYILVVDISPDVSQIVYSVLNEANTFFMVRLVGSQGGGSRTLVDSGVALRWRPDGQRIGYMRLGSGTEAPSTSGKLEIWSIRSDGTDNRLELTDTVSSRPTPFAFSWSPDGESIAWVRNFPEGYGEVIVRELATGRERQLTFDKKMVDEMVWATNNEILFVSNKSGQSNLWTIPAGGGEATPVTEGGVPVLGARISADNKTLIYLQRETVRHIWISAPDGSTPHQVTSVDLLAKDARFSPDAKHIACVFADVDQFNQEAHQFVMDRDGKNQRQLTSGSESVDGCRWSSDGKWLAYSSRALGAPNDSTSLYLIQPFNPGVPRLLCKSTTYAWVDSESIVAYVGIKTLQYSIKGGTAKQVYQDSTFAIPIQGNEQLLVKDFRMGQEGLWIVSLDELGRQTGKAKKIVPSGVNARAPQDQRFWVYRKGQEDELWRVWTSTGKEERFGKALPGQAYMCDVGSDGKEILWIRWNSRSKLVLVKNVFE
jgi:serine/threonine protein kinase/Tol biopolymer transport system component